jgi:DNA-binding NarL/FixJ family response regulator
MVGGERGATAIEEIRIALVDVPQLVADLVGRAVERQPDMAIVGASGDRSRLLEFVRTTAPDVVILGHSDGALPPDCKAALAERPQMRLLGLDVRRGLARLWELRPHPTRLGEISAEEIAQEIRAAAQQRVL